MEYTEAELRERMIRQHTQIRPDFRLVSGAFVGSGYRPGTMDVKIPKLFFPPDTMQDVSETFLENPDGTFGTRAPEDQLNGLSSYGAEAQQQLQSQGAGMPGKAVIRYTAARRLPERNIRQLRYRCLCLHPRRSVRWLREISAGSPTAEGIMW